MCFGSAADARQRLVLMLAAAQREPALIRRPKRPSWGGEDEIQTSHDRLEYAVVANRQVEEKLEFPLRHAP